MHKPILAVALILVPYPVSSADLRVGPVLGASVLERTDTSLSHGPLTSEVTYGRTALFGVVAELALAPRDVVSVEVLMGPYNRDRNLFCVPPIPSSCELREINPLERAVLYGMRYAHELSGGGWSPYVAGGFGIKRYSFEGPSGRANSPTLLMAVGGTRRGRVAVRIETAAMLVLNEAFGGVDKDRFELQVRAAFPLGGRPR